MSPSIEELRSVSQSKDATKTDYWYAKLLMRRISVYFTKFFLKVNVTANQVSILNLALFLLAGLCLSMGDYLYSVFALILLQWWMLNDSIDGELARWRMYHKMRSESEIITGAYLEQIQHSFFPAIFIFLSFNIYNATHDVKAFIFGFLAAFFEMFYLSLGSVPYPRTQGNVHLSENERSESWLFSFYQRHSGKIIFWSTTFYTTHTVFNMITVAALLKCLYIPLVLYGVTMPMLVIPSVFLRLEQMKRSI